MIIGCDLDGTICDNLPLLVEELNHYTGQNITLDQLKQYDITKTYSITRAEFIQLMRNREDKIIANSPIFPHAGRYLRQLASEHQLHIITARSKMLKQVTKAWLKKHQLPYHSLNLLNSHDKVAKCKELAVDVMVEDNYNNAVQLRAAGVEVILLNAPHNINWPWPGERCANWHEIYALLA